ncbi:carbon-nitrogen hydrolase family protein [Rhizobium sp. L1K21]|uniref:carbon-nitrogen hydrolase family protein n=1 Tax=Rhizobium sp. L1K21 TaxID=2954933 RepID=UPI0020935E3F|nr:carbon-nitrogen hydrolase family protein [Rhizobium sp. L1K21]MCO6188204.1 carbon-nitrogen hydrolase family protein [Rhizobium sp. L1K21]
MHMKVAAIQMCSGVDPAVNVKTLERMVGEAVKRGATYVQTPEMTGAVQRSKPGLMSVLKNENEDLIVSAAAALSAHHEVYLHIGSTAILLDDGKIANRAFLFGPDGKIITRYDKIHMFDVDLDNGESWRESSTYRPGEAAVVADLPFGKLGFAICYDVRFPHLFRQEAQAGAQILTVPAAFTKQTGEAHWEVLLRARAIENGTYLIAAAQAGLHEDGRETFGHSMVIDPWGRIVAAANGEGEAIVVADIDLETVASAREKIPNLKNGRAFEVSMVTAGGSAN